jgi:hypothetical protein
MKNIIKNWRKWLVAWAFLPAALAQQSNTVYTTIGTDVITLGVLAQKPRQIGQSFHLLTVAAANVSGCTTGVNGWVGEIQLEGSFNNSIWLPLGNGISQLDVNTQKYATASGSFPYLRVNYISGNVAACKLNIWYSGNITGSLTTNSISAVNDGFQYGSVSGAGFGALTAAGTGITCSPNTRMAIYSLSVINAAATAASVAARLYVVDTTTSLAAYTIFLRGLGAGQVLSLANGPRPIYLQASGISGNSFDLVFDQGGTDGLNITAVARCE